MSLCYLANEQKARIWTGERISEIRTNLNRFRVYNQDEATRADQRRKTMPETVPEKVEKAELLKRVETGYAEFEALLAPLSAAQMTTPDVNGPWSVKDNLAHLTVWQDYLLSRLLGAKSGKKPPEFMPGLSSEDEINEHIYQQNKDRPLAEVQATFRASYQGVLSALREASEESLNAPFPWVEKGDPIWAFIVGNTYGHYQEHGDIIRRWLQAAQSQ
jgi:hypothetical protein